MSSKIGGRFFRRTDVKLTLWYILTFILSALIISGFLYIRLRHQLIKEVDRFILDEIKELGELLAKNPDDKNILKNFEYHIEARILYPIYFRILTEKGDIFYSSNRFEVMGYKLDKNFLIRIRDKKEIRENLRPLGRKRPYRIITTIIQTPRHSGYIIQVGTYLKFVRKSLANFKINVLITLPILIVLGSIGGWFLAKKSLLPISYIITKTKTITSENLGERLVPRGTGDEMDELIETINGMISRLDESFKRITEFTADVSHELKTPISAMKGEAEVLLSKERGIEEYQDALVHFLEEFDRMNHILNDLILLSKADSQIELKMSPLRLDDLLEDVCTLFKVLAEQKNISFIVGPLEEIMVMGDKIRIQQLFTNLIDNAIKYTSEGSIHVSLEKKGDIALARIKDTGIGIPKEEQKNIFKRFYRVNKSRSRESGGVGLGLSIAQCIVNAHRGKIEVDSEPNQGSIFTISLPLLKI